MSYPGGWSAGSGNGGGPGAAGQSSEVNMLMDQVRQLQQQVQTMSQGNNSRGQNSYNQYQPTPEGRILLVSNIPNSVASCDALFFMFERWSIESL